MGNAGIMAGGRIFAVTIRWLIILRNQNSCRVADLRRPLTVKSL